MNSREKDKQKRRVVSAKRYCDEHKTGFSRESINIPEGAPMFLPKEKGIYRIDIIPYVVGKGNRFADEGELHYERTYFTHRGLGDSKDSYTCLKMTFGINCPICDYRSEMANDSDGDPNVVKNLKPKERQLWNIIDLADRDKGIQIWEVSHFCFGKHLIEKIKMADEGDGYDTFADLEQGLTLKIGATEESIGGTGKFLVFGNIEFKSRVIPYDDSMADKAFCLDELPKNVPYAQLKKKFQQEPEDKEDLDEDDNASPKSKDDKDDEPKSEKKSEKKVEKDSDDPSAEDLGIEQGMKVRHKEHGICEVVHVSSDGTSLRLMDEDGEKHTSVAPSECKVIKEEKSKVEDDDDEPKSKKRDVDEDEDNKDVEFELGNYIMHDDFGKCQLTKELGNGRWAMEDEDGEMHKAPQSELTLLKSSKKKVVEDDNDEDDDEPKSKSKDDDEFEDD